MTLLLVVDILSNNGFAQPRDLSSRTVRQAAIEAANLDEIPHIDVGASPIAILDTYGEIFVVNEGSDTVSVISTENNTKIKDIEVGENPEAIAIADNGNLDTDTLFVANPFSDFVSVKDVVEDIPFEWIPVENGPVDIAWHEASDTVYVANRESNSISVIEPDAGKVVAGVTFHVNPFGSGRILCDELTTPSPTEQYVYVDSGDECIATPNEGFEFASWEQNLEDNSTQLVSVAGPASIWGSHVSAVANFPQDNASLISKLLRGDESLDSEAKLTMTKFGTFTANFREAPPPLPPEFWAQMYAVIATVITALFIPSIVGWFKSKREANKLNYFHKQVAALYQDGKLDENDIEALDYLRNRIGDAYSEGKLNEKHYEGLRTEISANYEEIFRKKINALNSSDGPASKKTTQEQLAKIRNEIKYAFSKGKINEKHYALLNEDISKLDGENSNNTS